MMGLTIRTATADDIGKINAVNLGEDGPWADYDSCKSWMLRRLERGFYIQLAELDTGPVGHGEWIVSDEPSGRTFFLGQLQVAKAFQRKGIGRLMLADGEEEAVRRGCTTVTLIPEPDTDANYFYEKCGYEIGRRFFTTEANTSANVKPEPIKLIDEIPESAVYEKRFALGFTQSAARHMWEVVNRRPDIENDSRNVRCAEFPNGCYAAVYWFNGSDTGYAIAFGEEPADEIIGHCFTLAHSAGVRRLCLELDERDRPYLRRFITEGSEETFYEMVKRLS